MRLPRQLMDLLPEGCVSLVSGLLAYASAEAATRILRIVALVVIARRIEAEQIGVAALAIALFELVRVLANSGIGQRIVSANDSELDAICLAAHRLFYLWCGAVALVQLAVAAVVWLAFGMGEIGAMLAVLAIVYAIMPAGLVQVFLLMRDGRLPATARIAAVQTSADHLLSMALVLIWPSAWALVLPKLLTAPIWLVLVRRARQWRPEAAVEPVPTRDFVKFGAGVLGTELTVVARGQLDKLIVGGLLGTKALGYYYFAFNAGLGITSSIVGALSIVLFPHLASAPTQARGQRLRQSIWLCAALFGPVVLAQALFAPFYVPVVFGAQWSDLAPLVSILCLGAIPALAAAICTAWLRADGRPERDAANSFVICAAALGALTAGACISLPAAAWAYVAALWAVQAPISWRVLRPPLRAINCQTSPLQETLA